MIYFLLSQTMRAVKIGRTNDPARRAKEMQPHSADVLILMGSIDEPAACEAALHTYFMPFHIHGEWFRFEGELERDVHEILTGIFDMGRLPQDGIKSWCHVRRASGLPSPNGRPYLASASQ